MVFRYLPGPLDRDPQLAVNLAAKGVAMAPKYQAIQNTLGVATIGPVIGKTRSRRRGVDGAREGRWRYNWFFMAMSHWQLGDSEQARKYYAQAVEWMDKNKPKDDELRRFRAEAAELLGIDRAPFPANPPPKP